MTDNNKTPGLVIIGSGLAGYSLAREYRKLAPNRPLTIITGDGGEMYSKPMLSAAFAQGKAVASLVQKKAEDAAAEWQADILTQAWVTDINRSEQTITYRQNDQEAQLSYEQLVLAIGSSSRRFPVSGDDQVPVSTVNSLEDYGRWRERIGEQGRILLIGAGLIGSEFANDLTQAGFKVDLVDPAPWPLARLLPAEVGRAMAQTFVDNGAGVHMGRTVAFMQKNGAGNLARLDDGTEIAFDHVLMAVGVGANLGLARDIGLEVGAGIKVDRLLRTSDPNIFALGDCAETGAGPLPFVLPLMAQARALAATLTGTETPLVLPAMPVVVKTPLFPVVVCPPSPSAKGAWELEGDAAEAKAIFRGEDGKALGFVLSGSRVAERMSLAKEMPALL